MKFVIDCLGGDNSPRANVLGALRTMEQHADLSVIFAGDKPAIVEELRAACAQETMRERIEILHAPDAISGEDKPTDAIRLKKDSSMVRAFQ
ncbi:MAG: phosphate--acyl-ACP acyltransferase, partial [Oscillospiraceae bacterium]|nr:phosphate--acyl-ACP acyltransferase [Oscillospiraceae bacterium]